jgi:predicted MPP superfamily phosphohydrolase
MAPSSAIHQDRICRRELLRGGLAAFLTLSAWPGVLAASEVSHRPFKFIVVNDTHYMSPECGVWLESALVQMRSHEGVEFCLVAGDLVEKGERAHLAAVRDLFSGLGMPVYTQIGNHDYLVQNDRRAYEELFPGRINYSFRHQGWQFVGLDSSHGTRYEKTYIQPSTFAWLDRNLPKLDVNRPTVIFTHFPLGANVTYRPLNADYLLKQFQAFNLRAIFSGHFHGFTERVVQDSIATTNRCCALKRSNHDGTRERGFLLCTAEDGHVHRRFIEVPLPARDR